MPVYKSAPKAVFILGTGTAVGKTWFSAFLVRHLQADYWKPVQVGSPHDSEYVQNYLAPRARIHSTSYVFPEPISPHLAARRTGCAIEITKLKAQLDLILTNSHAEFLVIESAGGICSPLSSTQTNVDLACMLKVPTILVSRAYLGCLSHAIASYRVLYPALCASNTNFLGWVLNGYDSEPYAEYIPDLLRHSQPSSVFYQIRHASAIYDYPQASSQLRASL